MIDEFKGWNHTELNYGIKLVGLSGKKQSGKNTVCDVIKKFVEEREGPDKIVKIYSFADVLKENICIGMMNLSREQCFGTNEEKNTFTTYKWEKLPYQIRYNNKLGCEYAPNGEICHFILPTGYMTAREIMQVIGTDIFRNLFSPYIHINATLNKINRDNPYMAIISDVRFQTEVMSICANAGFTIRLTRNSSSTDTHESETALDNLTKDDWEQHNAFVIDNINMSIEEQASAAIEVVKNFKYYWEYTKEEFEGGSV